MFCIGIARVHGVMRPHRQNDYTNRSQVNLLNNLFAHPYTKIEFIQRDLEVSRLTAAKYLDALVEGKLLQKRKLGRSNYYINAPLFEILLGTEAKQGSR
jgi:Fic family protein